MSLCLTTDVVCVATDAEYCIDVVVQPCNCNCQSVSVVMLRLATINCGMYCDCCVNVVVQYLLLEL